MRRRRSRGAGRRRARRFLFFPPVGARLNRDAGRLAVSAVPLLGWAHYFLAAFTTPALPAIICVGIGPTAGFCLLGAVDARGARLGFALLAWLATSAALGLIWRPRLAVRVSCPGRVLCGTPFPLRYEVTSLRRICLRDIAVGTLFFPDPFQLRLQTERLPLLGPGATATIQGEGLARRRGRYLLPPLRYDSSFPGGLWRWGHTDWRERLLIVYPRFRRLERLELPLDARHRLDLDAARRLARSALEFHGCREYRDGDALRHVHPRSSARLGVPVVKEFQAEGRGRAAVLVDTWRAPGLAGLLRPQRDPAEQVISLAAAVVDALSRSDRVLELLAAGPGIHRFVSAGRSGYLDEALGILAALETCARDPLKRLGPLLLDEIRTIQSVCLLLTRWDACRAALVERLEVLRTELKIVVVTTDGRRPPGLPDAAVCLAERAVRQGEVTSL